MNNEQLQQKYQCIDCMIVLDTEEDISNSAICADCLQPVCEECVITDNECYQCSECYNNQ